jgi:sulfate permease, SulP family
MASRDMNNEQTPLKYGLSNVTVGLTTGAISVVFALSYAVFIFSGSLASQLSVGVGLVIFSVATTRVAIALTSSYPGMVADVSTVPTAILAWSVGMATKSLPPNTPDAEMLVTVLATIALTSILTGSVFFGLGHLDLDKIAQWLPQSVLGGFIASTGWLLVKGALRVMTGESLDLANWAVLMQQSFWLYGLPGILFGIYLLVVTRRYSSPWVMSASLVGAITLFYLMLLGLGGSVAQAITQGWLLPMPPPTAQLSAGEWVQTLVQAKIHWRAIAAQWMCIATVTVTATLSLLLNVKSLALVTKRSINANREFKVAGLTNVLLGVIGGWLSFQSLGKSILANKMGGSHRLTTLVDAAVLAIVPLVAMPLLAYFPKPVLGGLLMFLGLSLLVEWVYGAWFKLARQDYLIVQVIWLVSATVGFLQGLTLGWLLALLLLLFPRQREVSP